MNNEQLDIPTIVTAIVIAIIGLILFLVGRGLKKRFMYSLGIAFFLGSGVSLFVKSAEIREILTAAASVFAVFIAAISINETRRIRSDSMDKENRDRKERLVNEIIDWATEVIEHTAGQTALKSNQILEVISSGIPLEVIQGTVSHEEIVKLNRLSAKGIYVESLITKVFPNMTDLRIVNHKVRRRIYEQIRYLELVMKGRVKNIEKASRIHLTRLQQDAINLVEIAVAMYAEIK